MATNFFLSQDQLKSLVWNVLGRTAEVAWSNTGYTNQKGQSD